MTWENVLLTRLPIYYIRLWHRNHQMEEVHREVCGKGKWSSWSVLGLPLSQHLHMFTNPRPIGTPSFWVFMEALLHIARLGKLAISDWTLSPASVPQLEVGGGGVGGTSRTESQPFNPVIGPLASLYPFPKSSY